MKIGPLDAKAPVSPVAGERQSPKSAPSAAEEASAQVELSATASLLASDGSEFDAEKVARVGEAIRNGSFKVNPEVIADKLIANASELLSKSSH